MVIFMSFKLSKFDLNRYPLNSFAPNGMQLVVYRILKLI